MCKTFPLVQSMMSKKLLRGLSFYFLFSVFLKLCMDFKYLKVIMDFSKAKAYHKTPNKF